MRLPIVGIMGSSTRPHRERAEAIGGWLATQPVHLLTGGGTGVMAEVSRAFSAVAGRKGMVIGVIPGLEEGSDRGRLKGYPNEWVDIAIRTHLTQLGDQGSEPLSRNHINILSSDVLIVFPGSHGTASEAELALRYEKPVIGFLDSPHQIEGLTAALPIEPNLERVKAFVLKHIKGVQ